MFYVSHSDKINKIFVSIKAAVQVHLHFTYFIRFYYTQLCGRCLVNMPPVVKVVIHCVIIVHYYKLSVSVR